MIRLAVLALAVQSLYVVWRGLTVFSWGAVAFGGLGLVACVGLAMGPRWSEPLVYVFVGLIAVVWIRAVVAIARHRSIELPELGPGVLLLAACVGSAVLVRRHFHPRR